MKYYNYFPDEDVYRLVLNYLCPECDSEDVDFMARNITDQYHEIACTTCGKVFKVKFITAYS
jgi:transcription elongation factor Elf1